MVRKCSVGVASRTGCRLGIRCVMGNPVVGAVGLLGIPVVGETVFELVGVLGQESLEFRTQFVTAGKILVASQKRPVVLSGNESIVLALQCAHHLRDFGRGLYLLVDLGADALAGVGQRTQRHLQRS